VKQKDVFDLLKKGGAAIADVSQGLMKNPAFVAAVATAYRGKEKVNDAVGHALKTMNVPTRSEFKRAVARIEALERELADRKTEPAAAPPAPKRRPAGRRKKAPPAGGA
jgi:polyhydroxyalkanoate synthesis regulator phasin